jgi:hypothetical protein
MEKLAGNLKKNGAMGMSKTNLKLFRQFYTLYPQIGQTLSDQFKSIDIQDIAIDLISDSPGKQSCSPKELLSRLSFSHFIELFKADSDPKRLFYESETIKNNWSLFQNI